jgi:hypothetical protein
MCNGSVPNGVVMPAGVTCHPLGRRLVLAALIVALEHTSNATIQAVPTKRVTARAMFTPVNFARFEPTALSTAERPIRFTQMLVD